MSEWLRPISRAIRYGLAGAMVVTPLVACKPSESIVRAVSPTITRPISDVYPPYACTPLNTITSVDGKIPIFDIQKSQSNPLAEIGAPSIMDRLSSGKYRLDYYQLGQSYPSQTRLQRNESGGIDLKQQQASPAEVLPRWIIDVAAEAQAPMVVTVLQELREIKGEDGSPGSVYERTLVGYRYGVIPELPYPATGELGPGGTTPGSTIVWGYDSEMTQKIIENEVNQLEKDTSVGAGLYPVDGYCIQETPNYPNF